MTVVYTPGKSNWLEGQEFSWPGWYWLLHPGFITEDTLWGVQNSVLIR